MDRFPSEFEKPTILKLSEILEEASRLDRSDLAGIHALAKKQWATLGSLEMMRGAQVHKQCDAAYRLINDLDIGPENAFRLLQLDTAISENLFLGWDIDCRKKLFPYWPAIISFIAEIMRSTSEKPLIEGLKKSSLGMHVVNTLSRNWENLPEEYSEEALQEILAPVRERFG